MEEKQKADVKAKVDNEPKTDAEQQDPAGILTDDFKKRLISAVEARQLMVRSVRGLDSKLSEISQIIQTTARKGETRAEVYSIQTNRSSLPAIERIDNLGRVLLEALRQVGYEAKLKEFRTSDSCMLYILADWSKISEPKPEEPLRRAPGSRARPAARPGRDPQARARPAASAQSTQKNAAEAPASTAGAQPDGKANGSAADPSSDGTDAAQAAKPEDETKEPKDSDTSAADQVNAEAPDSAADPDSKEVKTKKFDPNKMLSTQSARDASKSVEAGADVGSGGGKTIELGAYTYSTEANGERIPIIYPIVMPSRMPLLQ